MKTLLVLASTLIILGLSSCSKDAIETSNTVVPLTYLDQEGNDMLSAANGFSASRVDLYYMINGTKTRVLEEGSRISENFYVDMSKTTNKYYLAFFANINYGTSLNSITLIDFGSRVDTLTTSFKVWKGGHAVKEVWRNSELLTSELKPGDILSITLEE